MSPPPTSIDGTDITGATIDGQEVQEITVDGQTVFTAETIIDDFEPALYGDIGNTLSTYYSGDLSDAQLQTTNVLQGTQSLDLDVNGAEATTSTITASSVNDSFDKGDTVRFQFKQTTIYGNNTFSSIFIYGRTNADNQYRLFIDSDNNQMFLRTTSGGSFTDSVVPFVQINVGTTYIAEISWGLNDVHTIKLFETDGTLKNSFTTTDATHGSGDFGWQCFRSATVFDNFGTI